MIYLDSAATSLQKPSSVYKAVERAMKTMTSPGRGGHEASMRAADIVFACRMELANLFEVPSPEQVVFTFNATHGLNIAIRDLVSAGDKVVVSGFEHNAVMRPLYLLGADVKVVRTLLFDDDSLIQGFAKALHGAKAAVCTAMSNVFGYITPIEKIAELCGEMKVPLIVDASQLAGCGTLSMEKLGATYMAFPGHKGLLGPQGTGVLLCRRVPNPLLVGGSGSESRSMYMPEVLPDRLEAGTHNVPGIAGLLAGVRYVRRVGAEQIGKIERERMERFFRYISRINDIETFYSEDASKQGGILSVRHKGMDSEMLAQNLSEAGVAVRGGLHCAPSAHETVGTLAGGTVRFSFSSYTTEQDVFYGYSALKKSVNKEKT